ncbi:hypothetical protein NECAME_05603 [Necator americanus]|uniref:Uncharacterized protein n=1 Tax=Necator americanus TaxID=51031 RepID=W2SFQ5_NECAM|nr:hypothetical protein NECAME_05603 [Necator americanus]ETN68415.1 hypothetical protein NECAME_05603 [Necator americanus]
MANGDVSGHIDMNRKVQAWLSRPLSVHERDDELESGRYLCVSLSVRRVCASASFAQWAILGEVARFKLT